MKRRPSRYLHAGLMVCLAALVSSTACVDAQEFLLIENAVWLDDSCMGSSSEALEYLTADVAFASPLALGFAVTNHRVQNQGSGTNLGDDTEIVLDYAEVNLSFSGGAVGVASFEYQLPTNSVGGGSTTIVLIEFPTEVQGSLSATMGQLPAGSTETLVVEVIIHARTTGSPGSNSRIGAVESRPFLFPMTICYGCLAVCQPAEDCGGVEGDPAVCPSATAFQTTCGYAQGSSVVAPGCSLPD